MKKTTEDPTLKRRAFVQTSLATLITLALRAEEKKRAPRILLHSSWQVVNIGDIAHTPGVLALIEKLIPGAEDMSQMAVGKEMLFDKLPEDVRTSVVWHEQFWLTAEALSTYVRSAGKSATAA